MDNDPTFYLPFVVFLGRSLAGPHSNGVWEMTDDLVKRLRSRNVFAYPAEGQRLALLAEEAADRIEALEAENERLRALLYPDEMTQEDYEAIYGWGGQG